MKRRVLFAILAFGLVITACQEVLNVLYVPVSGVTLKPSANLIVGGTETLEVTIDPPNATNKNVLWTSVNPLVATVSGTGTVTGVGQGLSVINVTSIDGLKNAFCVVYVSTTKIAVTNITLKPSTSLIVGGTETLYPIIAPSNAMNKAVSWTSSNPAVAAVSAGGVVTGLGEGLSVITVTAADSGKTASCAVTVSTGSVAVSGVNLNKPSAGLSVGGTEILSAIIAPSNATNQNITWNSSNASVAAVSGGVVTGLSEGTATITVTSADGGKTASCAVTVSTGNVAVSGVTLNKPTMSLIVGGTETLYPIIAPDNATNQNVTWSSSNPAVAAVSAGGAITGLSAGTATVTVTATDGDKTAACVVFVSTGNVAVSGVTLNKQTTSLTVGSTETLSAIIAPANATNKNVTWSSSNPAVAAVSGGAVTGLGAGTATVTVTTADGGKTASCAVTVSPESVAVSGVTLNKQAASLIVGGTETLSAIIAPVNATNQTVTWSSSNPSVATVSAGGAVTAAAAGTSTITVTTADGGKTASCAVTVSPGNVAVSGVTLDKQTASITIGGTETLSAIIAPVNATNQNVTWSSSNPSVAAVSGGTVTGVSMGTSTITVTTADGGKTASCTVTVSNIAVSGVTLNKQTASLIVGGTETLFATIEPTNATNQNVTWRSSNTSVATVSGGVVTAVGGGTATITVTTANGGKTASCTVTVSVAVSGVTLNKQTASIAIGGKENLSATIAPSNATNKTVTWSSSNPAVATVSGGAVTGVSAGTATITVTTADGGKTASCAVTVNPYAVTFSALTADGSAAQTTTRLTLTFSQAVSGLSANNITLSGVTGVSKGTLSGAGAVYTLPISGFTSGGTLSVTVSSPPNYTISGSPRTVPVYYNASAAVTRVSFTGPTATVNLSGLSGNDIYLVKVNMSDLAANAANTGGLLDSYPIQPQNLQRNSLPGNDLPRMGHPDADVFNANPPPIGNAGPRRSRAAFVPPVVGDTRIFWVEAYHHSSDEWVQKQATLRATGQYGNIWIMDENYGSGGSSNKITDTQAKALSDKFDLIYPLETDLLGFEYGGGPGGDGGKDGDPKIQILVYDILDASGDSQTAGFFWSKDFYEQNQLTPTQKTNLAEIFYINAGTINRSQDYIYSTLIHEFQHMIHFNVKSVKQKKNSETWYNEMLSMMTEDIIAPMIGIPITNSNHKIRARIPVFLQNYTKNGITEWDGSSESYAKGIAFGAYLLRNYGGASLLRELLANNSTNIASVTAALNTVAGSAFSFEEALRRFGETLIYSGTNMPSGVMSFDKTDTKTISGNTYTAYSFNVWSDFGTTKPRIFGANEQTGMRPYSISVHQDPAWKNQSGAFSVTLDRPADSSIEFYLVRK